MPYLTSCRPRVGRRKKIVDSETTTSPAALRSSLASQNIGQSFLGSPHESHNLSSHSINTEGIAQVPSAYIGNGSLLSCPQDADIGQPLGVGGRTLETAMLLNQLTKCHETPSDLLLRVSTDLYFSHLYSSLPIFDRSDLSTSQPSLLLRHLLHFSGSLVKRPEQRQYSSLLREIYAKMKAILFFDMEPDKFTVLKTLCVLGCWSPNSPDVVTLDSSWHWTGAAMRLALQMGLHRESTYANISKPASCRKLWWCLLVT